MMTKETELDQWKICLAQFPNIQVTALKIVPDLVRTAVFARVGNFVPGPVLYCMPIRSDVSLRLFQLALVRIRGRTFYSELASFGALGRRLTCAYIFVRIETCNISTSFPHGHHFLLLTSVGKALTWRDACLRSQTRALQPIVAWVQRQSWRAKSSLSLTSKRMERRNKSAVRDRLRLA